MAKMCFGQVKIEMKSFWRWGFGVKLILCEEKVEIWQEKNILFKKIKSIYMYIYEKVF